MGWYRRLVANALLQGTEKTMFENWIIRGIFQEIVRRKTGLNGTSSQGRALDRYLNSVGEASKRILDLFNMGNVDASLEKAMYVQQQVPQMKKFIDTTNIENSLDMVIDVLQTIQQKKQQQAVQQQQWQQPVAPASPATPQMPSVPPQAAVA
jgi:hypothetical protein